MRPFGTHPLLFACTFEADISAGYNTSLSSHTCSSSPILARPVVPATPAAFAPVIFPRNRFARTCPESIVFGWEVRMTPSHSVRRGCLTSIHPLTLLLKTRLSKARFTLSLPGEVNLSYVYKWRIAHCASTKTQRIQCETNPVNPALFVMQHNTQKRNVTQSEVLNPP